MMHTDVELHIDSLALNGQAVARQDGFIYFVRNAVPGDVVHARIFKKKRNYAEAETIEVLRPSVHRVQPRCKYFGTCGGCTWQNVAYELQLKEKQRSVVDAFERIGGFNGIAVPPIIGSDDDYFYRNKMEFSFSRQRWLTREEWGRKNELVGQFGLGLHVAGRYDKVLDIDECWLQSPLSNAILNAVRGFSQQRKLSVYSTKTHEGYLRHVVIRQSKATDEVMVNVVTTTDAPETMQDLRSMLIATFPGITTVVNNITARKSMVAFGETEKVYHGPGYITEQLGKYTFRISANSFFQTNTKQAKRLYDVARGMSELSPSDIVYDLYCGTGTIAILISEVVQEVIGIDVVESAIADAQLNARLNNVQNCRFLSGDLKDRLTRDTLWQEQKPTVVMLDPPRSGLHPKVVREVSTLGPERIVYISCNPATQARDAKIFCDRGYELTSLQPVDMFPHTAHVENVAAFLKR